MTQITNQHDIPLLLAAWLVSDTYDYNHDPMYISATSLMKPIKQIALAPLAKESSEAEIPDLSDYIARSLGNSVHDSVERVWTTQTLLEKSLKFMGKGDLIPFLEVNPKVPDPDKHQVYIEQRATRKIKGYIIGGKFDAVLDGIVHDIKTTSAWAIAKGTKDEDYALQGSIYRWLNQDKITEDYIRVCFLFTDWSKAHVDKEGYPPARCAYKDVPLLSLEETERWITSRLDQITKARKDPMKAPDCTDEELWLNTPKHKYYADATKLKRATKVFTDLNEASVFASTRPAGGVIISEPLEARRCSYCDAAPVCEQKHKYYIPEP